MPTFTYGARTDVGRVRKKNQDCLAVVSQEALGGRADGLFMVADGMGGHAGGEIASRVAVETVPAVVMEELARCNGHVPPDAMSGALREAMSAANEAVWKQGRANPELRGMGTTCVAILARGATAAVGNVGDSRAYLLRGGRLRQLTADHSLVQEQVRAGGMTADEARESRFRNVITRGIGLAGSVAPDVELVELEEGDTLLLCSDGLSGMVRDAEIARILQATPDAQEACDLLVDAANRGGGEDNISVVVVRHGEFSPIIELDDLEAVEGYDPIPYPTRAAARRAISPLNPLALVLIGLACILSGLLIYVGRETYETASGWPPIRHKAPLAPPKSPVQPVIDLAGLSYDDPAVVSQKPVRSAPLACDSQGGLYAVTKQTGTIVRIGADGKASGDFPTKLPPASIDLPAQWAADPQGNLYVSFQADHVIRKYTPAGTRIGEIGKDSLIAPGAVALDAKGNIYVVDENVIKVLKALPAAVPTTKRPNDPTTQRPALSVEDSHATR